MSTEAYAYKSDFNSARDFRYRVRFTNARAAGGVAAQGNYVPFSVESLVADSTLTAGNVTKDIALAVERGNMRFAQIVAMLSEGENPVSIEPFGHTIDANGKVAGNANSFTIAVEYSREPSGYPAGSLVTGSTFVAAAVNKALQTQLVQKRIVHVPSSDPVSTIEEVTAAVMATTDDYTIVVDTPASEY
tara:strand:- start:9 stop:575 length:567 start_codon:yes stop_codon:yes gene_type:complete